MIKRKPLMYFTMVITLLGMFVTSIAMAQEECPALNSCNAGPYTLTAAPGANDEFPVKTTCYDSSVGTNPKTCYKYEYTFSGSGDVNKIDHVYFGIPYNCFDPINVLTNVYWSPTGTNLTPYFADYNLPCEGGGDEPFADYVCSVRVVRINPQPNKTIFFTETDRNGSGSIYIGAGRKKYGCTKPLITPGYDPIPPKGGRTFSECANFGQETTQEPNDDVSFYMVRSDEGCITRIWACEGLECPQCADQVCPSSDVCVEVTPEALPDDYVLQASFLRACPDENISVTHGSPYYLYKFYSGGTLYKKCLDLGNGKWTSLSNCY